MFGIYSGNVQASQALAWDVRGRSDGRASAGMCLDNTTLQWHCSTFTLPLQCLQYSVVFAVVFWQAIIPSKENCVPLGLGDQE
jgi:hypothetical protein